MFRQTFVSSLIRKGSKIIPDDDDDDVVVVDKNRNANVSTKEKLKQAASTASLSVKNNEDEMTLRHFLKHQYWMVTTCTAVVEV